MAEWVKICGIEEAPGEGKVMELEVNGLQVCLANLGGQLAALDNICPHRQGPLGQGWLEGGAVVCPWHSWAFDVKTGVSEYPAHEHVTVFPLKVEGDDVVIEIAR